MPAAMLLVGKAQRLIGKSIGPGVCAWLMSACYAGTMSKWVERGLHRIKEARFTLQARGVLGTPPLQTHDDGLVIFSMIGTRVIVPYLVAAKSLYHQLRRGRFVILDDGSLTPADRDVLAHHLDNPPVLSIADIDSTPAPRGGCWERLFALLQMRSDAYVIQLDSDTVTLGPVPEIEAAIAEGRDFTLRGEAGAEWRPIDSFGGGLAALPEGAHVQRAIEAVMDQAGAAMPAFTHYVRGCAGFAGFAPGGMGRDTCEAFCKVAADLIGADRWAQWGSEQVMSNLLVANEGQPVLLPYDRYLNYWAEPVTDEAAFVHFVGTYRFHAGTYARAAKRAIAAMR